MAQTAGLNQIVWFDITRGCLILQFIVTMLASQARPDFLTLTAVCITFYMIENTENLRRSTFRKMVGVIGLSLLYDLVWFGLNDQLDDSDGGMAAGVRKFSLWVSYFSFFFRVSVFNILSLDRGVSGAFEELCLISEPSGVLVRDKQIVFLHFITITVK